MRDDARGLWLRRRFRDAGPFHDAEIENANRVMSMATLDTSMTTDIWPQPFFASSSSPISSRYPGGNCCGR